jgi:sulfite reductase alpha subunit-like flavoprotein
MITFQLFVTVALCSLIAALFLRMLRSSPHSPKGGATVTKENTNINSSTVTSSANSLKTTQPKSVTIVYATQTGTSKVYADKLAAAAKSLNIEVLLLPCSEFFFY